MEASPLPFLVSGTTPFLHLFHFDTRSGAVSASGETMPAGGKNPSFLVAAAARGSASPPAGSQAASLGANCSAAAEGRKTVVYAALELSACVAALALTVRADGSAAAVDRRPSRAEVLSVVPSDGPQPCSVALSPCGGWLAVANYGAGGCSVFEVNRATGELADKPAAHAGHLGQRVGPRTERQDSPHPHQVYWVRPTAAEDAGKYSLLVPDLGTDKILQFTFDRETGRLSPHAAVPVVSMPPGSGPRHLILHPNVPDVAYCVGELDRTIIVLCFCPRGGIVNAEFGSAPAAPEPLAPTSLIRQVVSTVPLGPDPEEEGQPSGTAAEVQITLDGRYLLVSTRGPDVISVYAVDGVDGPTSTRSFRGALTFVKSFHTGGRTPRFFTFDPTGQYLFVCNQDSDNVALFAKEESETDMVPNDGAADRRHSSRGPTFALRARMAVEGPQCLTFL